MKNLTNRLKIGFLVAISAFFAPDLLHAQKPNLFEAGPIWEGKANGLELTLWQIPQRSSTHIPLRFVVEAKKAGSDSKAGTMELDLEKLGKKEFEQATANICVDCPPEMIPEIAKINEEGKAALKSMDLEITAVEGAEATLIYSSNRQYMKRWELGMLEARETFRTPGVYRLRVMPEGTDQTFFETTITVDSYQNLDFSKEMGFFIGGCLVIGAFFLVALWVLKKSSPSQASHPS